MQDDAVQYQVESNGVVTIRLNRAETHNAFDDRMIAAISEALDQAAAEESARVVILAAEGKSFCAGADINWMRRMAGYSFDENLRDAGLLASMLHKLYSLRMPSIARVQGAAYGGGVGLVSCCDMVVASPAASFCLSEVRIGLIPATISPYVIRAMGERAATRYSMTAEQISAQRAQELGLVSELVEADELDATVEKLVTYILRNGPRAVGEAKRLVQDFASVPLSAEVRQETSRRIAETRSSSEGREGLSAFLEKRKPNWIG